MSRSLAVLAVAATLASCGYESATCGRGRCGYGKTCISVFGDGRSNKGWTKQAYPQVDNEWWCQYPCTRTGCSGTCLEDPADDHVVVCAVPEVQLTFVSAGKSCLCDPTRAGSCYVDHQVSGFEITDRCVAGATVLKACVPFQDCDAGLLHAGDAVPGLRLYFAGNGNEIRYCPGAPANTLGPNLPQGKVVRLQADMDGCP
ncbi:MAG TPA: hypothetical protein VMZ28_21220 [Kofleriaceae bacterium]|nr:hypothetical protein [Kofleriaceae bacterium]